MVKIDGDEIPANEITVTVTGSVEVESHPWMLREGALNARTSTGHKSIEVETLGGKRVLVQSSTGTYHDVPLNNDDVILSTSVIFQVTTVTINLQGADIDPVSGLGAAYKDHMKYYADRKILLARINDQYISFDKKKELLDDLKDLDDDSTISCSLPGFSLAKARFIESGGLNIASWTNGPYCDAKIVLVGRTRVTLTS